MYNFCKMLTLLLLIGSQLILSAQDTSAILYVGNERSESVVAKESDALSLPFELDWNLIWIQGSVDQKTGYFIVDTGAPTLILNSRESEAASGKSTSGIGVGGTLPMQRRKVKSFRLGGVEQGGQAAYQIDLRAVEQCAGREIQGLIGYEQFSNNELLIDYPNRRMGFYPSGKNELNASRELLQTLKFTKYTHLPLLTLMIGKRRLRFVLDTGAASSLIHMPSSEDTLPFNWVATGEEKQLIGVDGAKRKAPIIVVANLQLGTEILDQLPLVATDLSHLSQLEGLQIDGVLGTDFLQTHCISIDYRKNRLHFWAAGEDEGR